MKGRCHSDFKEDGGCVSRSGATHLSESVLDYFPELSKAESLIGKRVGPSEPRVHVCQKPGGCFYGSPMRGKHQSLPGKVYGMAML